MIVAGLDCTALRIDSLGWMKYFLVSSLEICCLFFEFMAIPDLVASFIIYLVTRIVET